MPSILFLVNGAGPLHNDNHLRLPRAFAGLGWQTVTADHEDLNWDGTRVHAGRENAARFDLIWMLGFGQRRSFLDRMQLLRRLDQRRFVNPVDAYTYLHGKLPAAEPLAGHLPETHAAASAPYLLERLDNRTDWVLKPSGASFGRDVTRIRDDGRGRSAIRRLIERDGFAVMQRYVSGIEHGEVRCLLAGGEIVGCYRRLPPKTDIRANLAAGGRAEPHSLSAAERSLAKTAGDWLASSGTGFAAADIAGGRLIEINVANPGGLATLESLTGTDPAPRAAEYIVNRPAPGQGQGCPPSTRISVPVVKPAPAPAR